MVIPALRSLGRKLRGSLRRHVLQPRASSTATEFCCDEGGERTYGISTEASPVPSRYTQSAASCLTVIVLQGIQRRGQLPFVDVGAMPVLRLFRSSGKHVQLLLAIALLLPQWICARFVLLRRANCTAQDTTHKLCRMHRLRICKLGTYIESGIGRTFQGPSCQRCN